MSLASIVESTMESRGESVPASGAVALVDDAHEAHALGEHIAALAARLHAATYELLVLLAQFDARNGWNGGFLSCAHWLHSTPTRTVRASGAPAWRTGLTSAPRARRCAWLLHCRGCRS